MATQQPETGGTAGGKADGGKQHAGKTGGGEGVGNMGGEQLAEGAGYPEINRGNSEQGFAQYGGYPDFTAAADFIDGGADSWFAVP